ncbi:Patched domain-containing protein 3 [Trichinella nativa]|uniref:Patched domain-containing protein 3 n=1 Tax=Trichinella nativa TaxID=6335 RepID=A0A0V1KZF1_9BILA|nr:Patched domain-containing protein 3 [Trichinella nativa]
MGYSLKMDLFLHNTFERHGWLISRHPVLFVTLPLLVTLALCTGLLRIKQQLDIDQLYTPAGALSLAESKAVKRFWNLDEPNRRLYLLQILFEHGGANVLQDCTVREILQINEHIMNHLNYTSPLDGTVQYFGKDLCKVQTQCGYANTALILFLQLYQKRNTTGPDPNFRFRYPFVELLDMRLFMGYNVVGAEDRSTKAKVVTLNYPLVISGPEMEKQLEASEQSMRNYVTIQCGSRDVHPCVMFSRSFLTEQVLQSAISLTPAIGFLLLFMFGFTVGSNVSRDVVEDKRWEGVAGCVSSIMAIVSSVGLLLHVGIPLNGTIVAVPFLTMAIGIDDTFLTIQAWKLTDSRWSAEKRISQTLRQSGSAITLTSLTDIALFTVGLLSEMPAIQVFSIYTAVAMAFDYIYQITFFSAIVYLLGSAEQKKKKKTTNNCLWQCSGKSDNKSTTASDATKSITTTKVASNSVIAEKLSRFFCNTYLPLLCKPISQISLTIIYLIYVLFSFWGCSQIEVGFSASKLVTADSPARRFSELMDNYYLKSAEVHVYVYKAPDFRNETQVRRFLNFVHLIESTPYSGGPSTTNLWYHSYSNFLQLKRRPKEEFYDHLEEFFQIPAFKQHLTEIRWKNESQMNKIKSFFFTTTFHSPNGGRGWVPIVSIWRQISRKFSEFEPIIYGDRQAFIADQLISLPRNTLQTAGMGILSLMIMTAIFIPTSSSVFLVGMMLLSTDLGVIGLLAIWGVDLDPISMINILMSLDFSIEYAAHVCHYYFQAPGTNASVKLRYSLSSVGWPVIQGGIATILGVLPLTFVDYYISRTFFKTCFLVVLMGMFHAFVVLPVILLIMNNDHSMYKQLHSYGFRRLQSQLAPYNCAIYAI